MSRETAQDLSDALELEFYLDRESISYKITRGRSGEQLNVAICPECGDARSRVYLNIETGQGNCFVCGQTFNKLRFIHKHLGEPKWAETFAHVKLALKDQGWRPRRAVIVAVDETKVDLPMSIALPTKDGHSLAYLRDRGITDEYTSYFRLRYCEDAWWNYTKPDGSKGGQNFGERVIIPVFDLDGALVTFQGRDLTGTSESKYLFPSGLPGTGRFLYNGQNVVAARRVAMGEGAFDVAALKIALDGAADLRDIVPVGSFGKNLSYGDLAGNDQLGRFLRLKAAGLEEVIVCWDGEAKALEAALDACKLIVGIGLRAKIALMPLGKDPNEVSETVVQDAIRKATPYSAVLDIKWRIQNPYRVPAKRKSILSAYP